MEKKFLPERIDNPKSRMELQWNALFEAFSDGIKKFGHGSYSQNTYHAAMEKILKKQIPDHLVWQALDNYRRDESTNCLMSNLMLCKALGYKRYVFAKEFFHVLQSVNVDNVTWDMISKEFSAAIRFPVPILDFEGDSIAEIVVCMTSQEKRLSIAHHGVIDSNNRGRNVLAISWTTEKGAVGHIIQNTPIDESEKISKSWNKDITIFGQGIAAVNATIEARKNAKDFNQEFEATVLRCLIYIFSGEPDLREFKNDIRYQSPTSRTPVKAHKDLAEGVIYRVGFNWLKEANYTVNEWGVKPHLRYQPYGPGRAQYKLILVREHTRQRRQSEDI